MQFRPTLLAKRLISSFKPRQAITSFLLSSLGASTEITERTALFAQFSHQREEGVSQGTEGAAGVSQELVKGLTGTLGPKARILTDHVISAGGNVSFEWALSNIWNARVETTIGIGLTHMRYWQTTAVGNATLNENALELAISHEMTDRLLVSAVFTRFFYSEDLSNLTTISANTGIPESVPIRSNLRPPTACAER